MGQNTAIRSVYPSDPFVFGTIYWTQSGRQRLAPGDPVPGAPVIGVIDMTVAIAFIGLNEAGLSAALALSGQSREIHLTGWDPDLEARVAADRLKIFNPVCKRAIDAVRGANLVILSLPADDIQPTLKVLEIALHRDLPVIAMTPLHAQLRQWILDVLGKHTPFISIYPTPNSTALDDFEFGHNAARADAFEKSPVFIADAQDAPPAMLDLAVDIAVLLGGHPVFTSPEELDGLISANLLLHQLTAAALMKTTAEQPSWREGKTIAGRALYHATLPVTDLTDRETVGMTATVNGQNLARLLEDLIRNLIEVRDNLRSGDLERVTKAFQAAIEFREDWLAERRSSQKVPQVGISVPGKDEALKRLQQLGK
jgi:prephenate dehydrogenase